jgi:hypothetical protein
MVWRETDKPLAAPSLEGGRNFRIGTPLSTAQMDLCRRIAQSTSSIRCRDMQERRWGIGTSLWYQRWQKLLMLTFFQHVPRSSSENVDDRSWIHQRHLHENSSALRGLGQEQTSSARIFPRLRILANKVVEKNWGIQSDADATGTRRNPAGHFTSCQTQTLDQGRDHGFPCRYPQRLSKPQDPCTVRLVSLSIGTSGRILANLMHSYVVYGQKPKLGNDVEQQLAEDHDLPQ